MGSAALVGRISMLGYFFMFQTALEQFCGVADCSILLYPAVGSLLLSGSLIATDGEGSSDI